jgi:hypothetical protein
MIILTGAILYPAVEQRRLTTDDPYWLATVFEPGHGSLPDVTWRVLAFDPDVGLALAAIPKGERVRIEGRLKVKIGYRRGEPILEHAISAKFVDGVGKAKKKSGRKTKAGSKAAAAFDPTKSPNAPPASAPFDDPINF